MEHLEDWLRLIPAHIQNQSGHVLYSGRAAFSGNRRVYILGFRPGGKPGDPQLISVEQSIKQSLEHEPEHYSQYLDAVWPPRKSTGQAPMQKRVAYLAERTELDLRATPASNLIFVRYPRTQNIGVIEKKLIQDCWPFHNRLLNALNIELVIAMGLRTGKELKKLFGGATTLRTVKETHAKRSWRHEVARCADGRLLVSLADPSISAWDRPESDPSKLVNWALSR